MFQAARWQLVAWNVGVLTLILLVLGVVVYTAASKGIYNAVDRQLAFQQDQALSLIQRAGGDAYAALNVHQSDPMYRVLTTDAEGNVEHSSDCLLPLGAWASCPKDSLVPDSKDALHAAMTNGTDIRTVTFDGEPQRVLTFAVSFGNTPLGVIQISRPVTGEEGALRSLGFWLALGGLVGIALAALGSIFLANRALVPIRKAFARQREFTADASHELRTPLALIRANAEMLDRYGERLDPDDAELVGEIIRETDHLNRLISDLLTLARADAEKITLSTRPVDFRSLVSDVHEDLRLIAESRGIACSVELDGPVTIQGDEGRLRQLLLILLDNALKYTDPGGRVDISLKREDNHARLVVADTGIGIPPHDQPRIFDRFYRVDQAREHESGGTGLGLAIARWIVEAHHGHIKVESQVGHGTRFLIDLPAGPLPRPVALKAPGRA